MKNKAALKKNMFICLALFCSALQAQIITTVIGTGSGGYNGDSLTGLTAQVNLPEGGMAMDAAGNIYFCDYTNNRVRKYNVATGIVVNIAGNGLTGFAGDGGQAKQARLWGPQAVALDKQGNIYISDYSNYRIRKVNVATGIITTIAGTGTYGYNGDNILATNAHMCESTGIALDTAGNVYFSDLGNARVRRIDKVTGFITTCAGTGTTGYNGDNIASTSAQLNFPYGLDFDSQNNLYIADKANYRIRKVTMTTSVITTVAGNGVYGNGGNGGLATSANLKDPWDVDVDSNGVMYIADRFDNTIRKVLTGTITAFAGNTSAGYSGDNGPATSAMLNSCSGVVANKCGGVYIVDRMNSRIRKVSSFNFSATTTSLQCYGICTGSIGSSASGGLAPYTFNWGSLGSGSVHTNVCAGQYTASCTDANGCKEHLNITIAQPTQFTVSTITQTNVTCNTNGMAIPNTSGGAGGPYSYTWSASSSTTVIGNNMSPGVHTVSIKDVNNCIATKTFNILFTPTLSAGVNINDPECGIPGTATAVCSGASPFTYVWTSSSSTASHVTGMNAGMYSVTVTDANGCNRTVGYTLTLQTPSFASVPICFVTVDSLSLYNVITWDKTLFATADSFYIYRETGTNLYQPIRKQPYSALSQFVDTVKTLYFPNTGNPNVGTYRYKIKTKDTCNNFSNYSPYHNTLFLINNNGTFSWTQLYQIEGDPNPVLAYILERDDMSNGNWGAIGSVAGTQQFVIDPNYSSFVNTASWRVKTQWSISCTPSKSSSSANSSSYSNRVTNNNVGIKESNMNTCLNIYPNPTQGKVNIVLKGNAKMNKSSIAIFNILGEKIYEDKNVITDQQIDLNSHPNAVYFVVLRTGTQTITQKIVLDK